MEKKRILDQLGRGFLGLLSLSCTFASIREEAFAGVGDVSTSQAQVQTLLKKPPEFFADLYSEESALGQAKTLTTYTQVRAGLKTQSQLEFYGSARFGADSRTMFEKGTSVYNDNYLFLGAGVDYLGLLPGVRTVFQVGVSKDLSNKLDAGGLDGRVGVVTYHEIH
ncbi:MAG: hypothetical protein HYX41_01135 [Bdellovibrio sp.]|nr:hypothetical protein [Bdellovibrio sp.]